MNGHKAQASLAALGAVLIAPFLAGAVSSAQAIGSSGAARALVSRSLGKVIHSNGFRVVLGYRVSERIPGRSRPVSTVFVEYLRVRFRPPTEFEGSVSVRSPELVGHRLGKEWLRIVRVGKREALQAHHDGTWVCTRVGPSSHSRQLTLAGIGRLRDYPVVENLGPTQYKGHSVWRIRASGLISIPSGNYPPKPLRVRATSTYLIGRATGRLFHVSSTGRYSRGEHRRRHIRLGVWIHFWNYGRPPHAQLPSSCGSHGQSPAAIWP